MSIKEVEKGDLLFARKNTPELVGTTVYVPNEVRGLMFPDLVFRMKPKDVNALYLLAYMRSDRGLDLIQGMAHGSAKSMVNILKLSWQGCRFRFLRSSSNRSSPTSSPRSTNRNLS